MQVGIVTAPLDHGPSGPGVYLRHLARRLVDHDAVDLRLIHYEQTDDPLYDAATEVRLPRTPGLFERALSQLDLDALHYNYLPWKRPLVFALDVPLVVTLHGDLPFALPEQASWQRRYVGVPVQKLYGRVGVLDRVDAFVAVSGTVGSNVRRALGVPESKVTTVYSGVDEQFQPVDGAEQTVAERFGVATPYLLNVNNYMDKKNRATLLEAFATLRQDWPDLSLVLAGGGWQESSIPSLAADLGLEESIADLGFVPTEDLPLLYSGATAFVNPTLHETFGFTNVEAMACGCPVVTSDCFAVPEIVRDAAITVDDPTDSTVVGDATRSVLADEQYREQLGRAGRDRAAKFDWDRTADGVVDVYRSVSG